MVNYECLVISANQELEARGEETLYAVYPYDGLSIADSPLGYVDNGAAEKEQAFLDLQEYLLSDEVQNEIQRTGRRTGYEGVSAENADVFRADWGIQPDRVLSPIRMPSTDVLMECLDLYQTEFRKPSLTVYCLDYSGSMEGIGREQMVEAMSQILIQENAEQNLLQLRNTRSISSSPLRATPGTSTPPLGTERSWKPSILRWRRRRPWAAPTSIMPPWRACGNWMTTT